MFLWRQLQNIPDTIEDPVERRLTPLLQTLLVVIQLAIIVLLALNMAIGAVRPSVGLLVPNGIIVLILFGSLLLLRRGYLKTSLWIVIGVIVGAEAINLLSTDLAISDRSLANFFIPLSLAGLFLGRRPLALTTLVSIMIVWASAAMSSAVPGSGLPVTSTAIQYSLVAIVYAVLIDIFRDLYRSALDTALAQAGALERMQIDNVSLYHDAETERERLQVTLSSIGDAVITTDVDSRVTFMNPIAEALTGWPTANALGQPLSEVFRIANEETGVTVENPIARVLSEGVIVGLANHTVLITANGERIPISDSGAPIRSSQGRMIGAVLVFRDMQEERAAQIALEESELRFRTLADTAPVLIWMSDATKGCIYFNQPWFEFTGRSLERELGFGWTENVHPNDLDLCLKAYHEAFEARMPFTVDYRLRRHDGEYRWVQDMGTPRYASDGAFLGYIGSCMDVTERRQHESRTRLLQDVTARFSEALTPQQVAHVVMERVMALLGSHLGTLYTLSDDGNHFKLLSVNGDAPGLMDPYQTLTPDAPGPLLDAIRKRDPVWIENFGQYQARYPDMAPIARNNSSQAIVCLPLVVNSQPIGGISLSFADPMTFDPALRDFINAIAHQCAQALDRARLYEIEADARRQAEAANQLKLQFLAMISHELRTPLTSIKGFTSTLLATDVDWDHATQVEFLGILDTEADKLTAMVEQLLDVSRLQAGNLSIERTVQSFQAIVDLAEPRLQRLTQDYPFVRDLPPDLPLVDADGPRLAQVLTNLVENAARYSPSGSQIKLTARADGDYLLVTVTDQGIGIPVEAREAVFEAFHQLQQRRQGAGLGLAICRGLVEAHGGRIWIADQETPGTTFAFTLPVAHSR